MSNLPSIPPTSGNSNSLSSVRIGGQGKMSLAQRIQAKKLNDFKEKQQANICDNRIALLEDCSGSMSSDFKGKKLYKHMQDAVQSFSNACNFNDTSLVHVPFGQKLSDEDYNFTLTTDKNLFDLFIHQLKATGGTPLAEYMEKTLSRISMTRAIIISDGAPTGSPPSYTENYTERAYMTPEGFCYKIAEQYAEACIPIDTVHIGTSQSGADVLKKIAEITGGVFIKFEDASLFSQKFHYLAPSYRALLNAPGAVDELMKR